MHEQPRLPPPGLRRDLAPAGPPVVPVRLDTGRFAPPPSGGRVTPAFVLQALARWWTVALPTALVLAVSGAVASWLSFEPTFEAEAWLRIADHRPYVAFPTEEDSKRFALTQVETIRSPVVLSRCLSQPEIAQLPELKSQLDPLKWLTKRLIIVGVAESELFRVKFKGPNAANAAKIVNAVVAAYLKHHTAETSQQAQTMIDVLIRHKDDRIQELERMQERVRDLTKQVTGKDIGAARPRRQETMATVNPLAALEIRLANVEVEKQVIEVQLEAAQQALLAQDKIAVSSQALEQLVANDPEIVSMNGELQEIRSQIRDYERTSKNPADLDPVKALVKRRTELGNSLTKRKQELRKSHTEGLQESQLASKRDEVNAYIEELKKQQMLEDLLRKRLETERGELETYGDQALNLEFARAEMERAEEVFERITDRMTALQTEKAADLRVHLFGEATVPIEPVTTQTKFVAMVAGAMFLMPFALALLWEVRVRRVATVDQLREESRLPVIGEITALPTRSLMPGRRAEARFERQRSTFEESISHLRTSLVLCEDTAHLHVVAVASAVSREGKTSVAAQLAANMAKASNEPTLLVDADLRAPDIHEVMGVNSGPGLADVLSRTATLQSVIVPTSLPNVWVLPAGHSTISPHTLFTVDTYRDVLETLRAQFRYIVIDCPPLLSASEALTVAKSADGVLLCTMRDVSRVGQVREARDRLTRAGARPLGVVLSGVSAKSYTARYGGYGYATVHPGESFDGEPS